jgi:ABC-type transport system involved in cytochrome bd biosynthesis fused ATPase/permease subunit
MTITLTAALELFLTALFTVLAKFIISFVNTKIKEIKQKTQNELLYKYLDMINSTVEDCVIATNQTYVEALKNQNMFDAEAQKEAFKKTFDAVKSLLSQEAIEYLTEMAGDADLYISTLIEAEVNKNKGSK